MNWDKVKIRCSSLGDLMTEPQSKAEKEAGELSATAKTMLINTYIQYKYNRKKDIETKQMRKGKDGEEAGIEMLSLFTGRVLLKNDERLEDDDFTGEPDIFEGEEIRKAEFIWDTKLSWDIWTFLANVPKALNKDYYYQLQGYFALTGAKIGAISYVLADCPEHILEEQKYRLFQSMRVISEEDAEFVRRSFELEQNLTYPDIPLSEKILPFYVERNDELIDKMRAKVKKARQFLAEFEQKHLDFSKK